MHGKNFYKEIYNRDYFTGKNSFFYGLGYGSFSKLYFNNIFKPIVQFVGGIKNGRVLDIGCAYGFMLQKFPDSWQKFGVDVSEYAINIAQKRLPKTIFVVKNVERSLPFKENFFDVILLNDVLEHLKNPQAALKNVYKILKKEGVLYITTPNLTTPRKTLFRYADEKEHHISMFSHSELKNLLNTLGFRVKEHWTFIDLFVCFLRFRSNAGIDSAFICKK